MSAVNSVKAGKLKLMSQRSKSDSVTSLRHRDPPSPRPLSEGALQQAAAAAAGRTLVLPPKPVHHVTGVSSVAAAQAEVGGAADGHVADGALEGEAFADGALSPPSLTAAVTAEHAELCGETT